MRKSGGMDYIMKTKYAAATIFVLAVLLSSCIGKTEQTNSTAPALVTEQETPPAPKPVLDEMPTPTSSIIPELPSEPDDVGEDIDYPAIYQQALERIEEMDLYTALTLFEQLPDDYEDANVYIMGLSGIKKYEDKAWLEASNYFSALIDAIDIRYPRWTINSPMNPPYEESLVIPIFRIIYNVPLSDSEVENSRFVDYISYYDYYELLQRALYQYYYEQTLNGNDIARLEYYPYKLEHNRPGSISLLYTKIRTSIEESLDEQGLNEYYNLTDSSISPVEVSGDKLYITYEGDKGEVIENLFSLMDIRDKHIAPCCLALEPESIRYVLKFQESYTFAFSYSNNTKGYTSIISATIKDVVTGEILYSFEASVDPPRMVEGQRANSDTYGRFGDGFNEAIGNDLLVSLENLGIITYRY